MTLSDPFVKELHATRLLIHIDDPIPSEQIRQAFLLLDVASKVWYPKYMKIKLTISNSRCQVEGLTPELEKALKAELRYLNQAVAYTYHGNLRQIERIKQQLSPDAKIKISSSAKLELMGRIKSLEGENRGLFRDLYKVLFKDGSFSTGLLPKFLAILNGSGSEYEIDDRRRKPAQKQIKHVLKESFPPRRYYQRAMSRLFVEKGRGIGVAPTGTGKTLTIASLIWEMGVKTLIITPNKAITVNMIDTLVKHFGKSKVTKLTTKSTKTTEINVCNIQALVKMNPAMFEDVDCVIIDEFHHAAAETYQEVNEKHLKNVYYRIGMTATNFRNDGSDLALEAVLSEVLYEYGIKQAIEDGFLVRPEFQIEETFFEGRSNYQDEYKEGIVENDDRNALIAQIAEHHKEHQVIILVQHVEHGERLKALIPHAAFLHGTEKDLVRNNTMEDYRKGKITCLIGTSVIGEGVDLPCAAVLVMAGGGKARSAVMQNIGRVLRPYEGKEFALVYDFTDTGTGEEPIYLEEHSKLRQEIYAQY